jgi:hypothetical protein
VTVIDSQIAEKRLMERLGEKKQVIYSVEDLVTEFDLKLRKDYTGATEFLVYGMVHPSKFSILSISACAGSISSFSQRQSWEFSTSITFWRRRSTTVEFHPCCNLTLSGGTDMPAFWAAS